MESPRVTFIIAHHNYENYLEGCIDSALNQTYKNIHVCVIDDCSNDQKTVRSIIEKKLGKFKNIEQTSENVKTYNCDKGTYIELTNGPYKQAYARNRGIEACWESDYFAILDADDENCPEKIEKCLEVLESDPNRIGAVYTDTKIFNIDTDRLVLECREPFDNMRLLQRCIVHSGCVISKNALLNTLENGVVFDESMPPVEDYDLWVRISEKFLIIHIPEPLVFVRVHSGNSTNTTTHQHRTNQLRKLYEKRKIRNEQ